MPNLQNLRKQAKQLVRWHKEKNHSVATRIRAGMPEYRDWSDIELLEMPFPLSSAQNLLAIEQGFESWAALTEGVDQMMNSQESGAASSKLLSVNPQVFVRDVYKSASYYKTCLGFKIFFLHGEPPFYGEVGRDDTRINLRAVCEDVIKQALREKESLLSAYFNVSDVKTLYLEYQDAEVDFFQPLKMQPWKSKDFVVRDPDGNLLCFAQQLEATGES